MRRGATALLAARFATQQRLFNQQVVQQINKLRTLVKDEEVTLESITSFNPNVSKPGEDFNLNWSLAPIQVNPSYLAFQNADVKQLVAYAYGKTDKNKALLVDNTASSNFEKLVANKSLYGWNGAVNSWDAKYFRRSYREVSYHLSHVPALFVQDGTAGQVSLRVVTDNAVAGLFLKHIVDSSAVKQKPVDFKFDALVLHAPGYQFTPARIVAEFGGPSKEDLGLSKDEFLLVNEANNQVVMTVQDVRLLQEAIAFSIARFSVQKSQLLLSADAVAAKDGSVTLVFGNDKDVAGLYQNTTQLVGAQHVLLGGESSVKRVWKGYSVETSKNAATRAGDLVEQVSDSQVRITRSVADFNTSASKAKRVVFVLKDGNHLVPALAKVDAATASNLYATGLQGIEKEQAVFRTSIFPTADNPAVLANKFKELLPQDAEFYVVNSATEKNVAAALNLINSGEAAKLQGQNKGAFAVLKHASLQENAWKDEAKYNEQVAKLFATIQTEAQKFPKIPEPQPQQPAAAK